MANKSFTFRYNTAKRKFPPRTVSLWKQKSFLSSISITRDYLAVLRYNEGIKFELVLRDRLKLPKLNMENEFKIQSIDEERENKCLLLLFYVLIELIFSI